MDLTNRRYLTYTDIINMLQNKAVFADNAIIKNINLSYLDLSYLVFEHSYLENINFSNCILNEVSFRWAYLINCRFDGVDLSTASFMGSSIQNVRFEKSFNLDLVELADVRIIPSNRKSYICNGYIGDIN